jgi:hypothetical protein
VVTISSSRSRVRGRPDRSSTTDMPATDPPLGHHSAATVANRAGDTKVENGMSHDAAHADDAIRLDDHGWPLARSRQQLSPG